MKSPFITLCALVLVSGSIANLVNFNSKGQQGKGRLIAKDFKVTDGDYTTEVEGICKIEDSKAACWSPKGANDPNLSQSITLKLQLGKNLSSSNASLKTRLLVMKTVARKSTNDSNWRAYPLSSGKPHQTTGMWVMGYATLPDPPPVQTSATRVERRYISGRFEKDVKSVPLRYQASNKAVSKQIIPLPSQTFTIDGNTFEIVSVSERNEKYYTDTHTFKSGPTRPTKMEKVTTFKVKPKRITNHNSLIALSPADEKGNPYQWLHSDGSYSTGTSDSPRLKNESGDRHRIYSVAIDPHKSANSEEFIMNVECSKIKKLLVSTFHLTEYDFGKIWLDQK